MYRAARRLSYDGLPKYLRFSASDAHNEADWSGWNTWADSKIADTLAAERKIVLEAIAEEMNNLVNEVHDHLADEVKGLRVEVTALEETVEQLRSIINAEKAKVIDLPNLRRAN